VLFLTAIPYVKIGQHPDVFNVPRELTSTKKVFVHRLVPIVTVLTKPQEIA